MSNATIDPSSLLNLYHTGVPDPAGNPGERVSFGTSGHRGTPLNRTFTEMHVIAIAQAICECRKAWSIEGPLFLGMDTHALSPAVQTNVLEVLVANNVAVVVQESGGYTPTPAISFAILRHNAKSSGLKADGIIITPSHNPPEDAGIKYNPPHGGPAESAVTKAIQDRANQILLNGNKDVRRKAIDNKMVACTDFCMPYVEAIPEVIDVKAIQGAKLRIGVHPLGGAALAYWDCITEKFGLNITIVDRTIDPTFSFMSRDYDGKIRMDCSSPHAMVPLISIKDSFDISLANDPDADRHGIVVPKSGLLGSNFFLASAIDYLLTHRPHWSGKAKVGKTVVSSRIIDRVVASRGKELYEVPVGFKWFAPGLFDGSVCFGGEESAGASLLCRDGSAWSTDKDGIVLCLLAAEMRAVVGDLSDYIELLFTRHGKVHYTRSDAPFSPDVRESLLKSLSVATWKDGRTLGGDPIVEVLEKAPGNNEAIGGLKIVTKSGWVAGRPSGTEPIFKIYAESDASEQHRDLLVQEFRKGLGL